MFLEIAEFIYARENLNILLKKIEKTFSKAGKFNELSRKFEKFLFHEAGKSKYSNWIFFSKNCLFMAEKFKINVFKKNKNLFFPKTKILNGGKISKYFPEKYKFSFPNPKNIKYRKNFIFSKNCQLFVRKNLIFFSNLQNSLFKKLKINFNVKN